MLLTVANLDRMGPPRPKNPNRIAIWVDEVILACSQEGPEPVIQPPSFWKKVLSRKSSMSSAPPPSSSMDPGGPRTSSAGNTLNPVMSNNTATTATNATLTSLSSKKSRISLSLMFGNNSSSRPPPPAPSTSLSPRPVSTHLPPTFSHHSTGPTEIYRTTMYEPYTEDSSNYIPGNQWGGDDFEGDNGESSLDMQSSESGVGWGARDRALRLDRAERLLNTNGKKVKMAGLQAATATGGAGAGARATATENGNGASNEAELAIATTTVAENGNGSVKEGEAATETTKAMPLIAVGSPA